MRRIAVVVCALGALGACARDDGPNATPPPKVAADATVGGSILPRWFGLPSAAPRTIAGQVWDGEVPRAATVHLRIAAADPMVWTGVDRDTAADGRFDLGVQRAGRYTIVALAPGMTSRVIAVDTLAAAADEVAIYAYRCAPSRGEVLANGRPLEGAHVELGGVTVATTDASGHYAICATGETLEATIRAPGYATTAAKLGAAVSLVESGTIAGDVVEINGKPAIGVAVEPIALDGETALPIQTTTDNFGRFTLEGVPRGGKFNFQIVDGTGRVTDRTTVGVADPDAAIAHVKLAYAHAEVAPATTAIVRGRIVHAGHPVGDARVAIGDATTRTHPDGSFALPVDGRGRTVLAVDQTAAHYATARAIAVHPGDALELTIEVATTGTIAGTIVDPNGRTVHGPIRLVARDTAVERTIVPGAGGHFAFAEVELGGTYDLDVDDGGRRASVAVTLDDGRPNVTGLEVVLR